MTRIPLYSPADTAKRDAEQHARILAKCKDAESSRWLGDSYRRMSDGYAANGATAHATRTRVWSDALHSQARQMEKDAERGRAALAGACYP